MGGIICKNCNHQITEAYRFQMFSSEQEMKEAARQRPIRWVHIDHSRRVRAFPTGVVCDAMYYGNTCMASRRDTGIFLPDQKPQGCKCQSPTIGAEDSHTGDVDMKWFMKIFTYTFLILFFGNIIIGIVMLFLKW